MAKQGDQWMPLYVGDYLRDTSRLTTEQHGAYLLILMDYWIHGPPPNDDDTLAAIARMPVNRWKSARGALLPFFVVKDGRWTNKRADEERANTADLVTKKRSAGIAGATARWAKTDSRRIADALPPHKQTDKQTDAPSPTPSPSLNSSRGNSPERASRASRPKSADTRDPATRKAVWEQKIIAHITAHWPASRANTAVTAYLEGKDEGVREFELADQEMRAVRTDGSIPQESHTTRDQLLSESLDGMALIRAAAATKGGRA